LDIKEIHMTVATRKRRGLAFVMLLGCTCTFFVAAAFLLHVGLRHLLGESAPLPLDSISLVRLSAAYLVGGMIAGEIFGWLLPRARGRAEAGLVGSLAAVPFLGAIRIAVKGLFGWTVGDMVQLVVLSVCAGVVTGTVLWKRRQPPGPERWVR
jgi:hypothetical protein